MASLDFTLGSVSSEAVTLLAAGRSLTYQVLHSVDDTVILCGYRNGRMVLKPIQVKSEHEAFMKAQKLENSKTFAIS